MQPNGERASLRITVSRTSGGQGDGVWDAPWDDQNGEYFLNLEGNPEISIHLDGTGEVTYGESQLTWEGHRNGSFYIVDNYTTHDGIMSSAMVQIVGTPLAGYYSTETQINNERGETNVAKASDIEHQTFPPSAALNRIQAALDYADMQIDTFFEDGPFTVPLAFMKPQAKNIATHWGAVIAWCFLYTTPGVTDDKGEAKRFKTELESVYSEMGLYKSGALRLAAQPRWPAPSAPVGFDA